jgi:DNA primase catalytic core
MAGRIPQSFIDDLTARADIVELIGSRVELKKAGREYRACCPFHNEKTPSFWVSPVKQFYHCFGCGAHGTALGFLMEYDKLSFPEAIEELASRLGLDVPREAGGQPYTQGSTTPLYDELRHEIFRQRVSRLMRARVREKRGLTPRPSTNSHRPAITPGTKCSNVSDRRMRSKGVIGLRADREREHRQPRTLDGALRPFRDA